MQNQLYLLNFEKEIKEITNFINSKDYSVQQFYLLEGGEQGTFPIFRIEIKKNEAL